MPRHHVHHPFRGLDCNVEKGRLLRSQHDRYVEHIQASDRCSKDARVGVVAVADVGDGVIENECRMRANISDWVSGELGSKGHCSEVRMTRSATQLMLLMDIVVIYYFWGVGLKFYHLSSLSSPRNYSTSDVSLTGLSKTVNRYIQTLIM